MTCFFDPGPPYHLKRLEVQSSVREHSRRGNKGNVSFSKKPEVQKPVQVGQSDNDLVFGDFDEDFDEDDQESDQDNAEEDQESDQESAVGAEEDQDSDQETDQDDAVVGERIKSLKKKVKVYQ